MLLKGRAFGGQSLTPTSVSRSGQLLYDSNTGGCFGVPVLRAGSNVSRPWYVRQDGLLACVDVLSRFGAVASGKKDFYRRMRIWNLCESWISYASVKRFFASFED